MDRPIFIFGPARSGTTLLRVLLGGHPRLAALDELNYSTLLVRAHQYLVEESRPLSRIPGFSSEQVRTLLLAAHRGPRDAIAAAQGKRRWIDNTHTTNDRLVHVLEELYDGQCCYLLVRRHPGDIVASTVERWPANDPAACVAQVDAIAEAQRQILEQIPERAHALRYEDLVDDADRVMAGVLDFLDEPLDGYSAPDALSRGARSVTIGDHKIRRRKRIDASSVGRWRTTLPTPLVTELESDPTFTRCLHTWAYV